MMYPGLTKINTPKQPPNENPFFGSNNRRFLREQYESRRIVPVDEDLPPVPSVVIRKEVPRKPVAGPSQPIPGPSQPIAGPSQPPGPSSSAPKPPAAPPVGDMLAAPPKVAKGPSAQQVSELEAIAYKFSSSEINIPKIVAEATIFSGIVLLNWSIELKKPQRALALVKISSVVALLALHPIYTAISIVCIFLAYAYFKLASRARKAGA